MYVLKPGTLRLKVAVICFPGRSSMWTSSGFRTARREVSLSSSQKLGVLQFASSITVAALFNQSTKLARNLLMHRFADTEAVDKVIEVLLGIWLGLVFEKIELNPEACVQFIWEGTRGACVMQRCRPQGTQPPSCQAHAKHMIDNKTLI